MLKIKTNELNPLLLFFLIFILGCTQQTVQQNETLIGADVKLVELGNNLFKIGEIVVDKKGRSFELTGHFIRREPPLEFLAVAKGGSRGYESLLELDTTVYEFNLACILIGLEKNKGKPPEFHFDSTPLEGDGVEIWIMWQHGDKKYKYEAADFFQLGGSRLSTGNWIYTGSYFLPDGQYMADSAGGTLVGFVHDPASIFEHRTGFMGMSELNTDNIQVPPLNTRVSVLIKHTENTAGKKKVN